MAFKKASTPQGLATATESKLFSGAAYDPANNTAGGSSRSPLGRAPLIGLNSLFAPLGTCVVFTEPGALVTPAALYLSMSCKEVPAGTTENRVILLRCAEPCNPLLSSSWTLVGTVFSHANAVAAGYKDFDGASLFEKNGSFYLVASPTSDSPIADAYNGRLVYQFANIDLGLLQPNNGGPAQATSSLHGTSNSFNGACGYHAQATASGVLYSELDTSGAVIRGRVYQSHSN